MNHLRPNRPKRHEPAGALFGRQAAHERAVAENAAHHGLAERLAESVKLAGAQRGMFLNALMMPRVYQKMNRAELHRSMITKLNAAFALSGKTAEEIERLGRSIPASPDFRDAREIWALVIAEAKLRSTKKKQAL